MQALGKRRFPELADKTGARSEAEGEGLGGATEQDARRSVSGGGPACGVRRETKAWLWVWVKEAFVSRSCEVKRPQGGSRSREPKKAIAQVGLTPEQDFLLKRLAKGRNETPPGGSWSLLKFYENQAD